MGKKLKPAKDVASLINQTFMQSDENDTNCMTITRQEVAEIGDRAVAKDAHMHEVFTHLLKTKQMVHLSDNKEEIIIYPDFGSKSYKEVKSENDKNFVTA